MCRGNLTPTVARPLTSSVRHQVKVMALDRADWHYGGDFSKDLPPENGGTHIGMFLAWIILNGLEGELHREGSVESLAKVRARQMTGREFLFKECDEKFWEEDLNEEGAAFAAAYYSGKDGYGQYITDYQTTLSSRLLSVYHVPDTWANYDKLAPIISAAYTRWRKGIAPIH